jgi:IclR family acetate operon transcriptional repressor
MLVKQAANVLSLLEYFAREKRPATLSEIAQEFGWPRSSTFNLVGTLVDRGYLYEPVPRGGYYPTPRWLAVAGEIAEAEPLPPSVHKLLRDLRDKTGETMTIAAPAGTSVVYLDVAEPDAVIRYFAHIGKRLPIQATAVGRAILMQYSSAERASILKKVRFEKYRPRTLMDIQSVEADILAGAKRGWIESADGFTADLAGVAVPLAVEGRRLSLGLGGPISRVESRMTDFGKLLRDATARFAANTGK